MGRDYELDRLKSEEQSLFQAKQAAWQRWDYAKTRASQAYEISQTAWDERCSAKETMNREFEAMKSSGERHQEVWDEYGRIRDSNNSRIEFLKTEADYEHQEMSRCFERASAEYEDGDKSMAPVYSQQGHEHKERRDSLNAEISELAREVREARQNAEWRAPKTDSSAFRSAQSAFNRAKEQHQCLEAEFKRLKDERDRLKAEFDQLSEEHKRAKEAFQRRLEEVKSTKRERDHQAVNKVNMALVKSNAHYLGTLFGQNAKVVPKNDGSGKTDVYFGGLDAAGDGLGHGHAVIDRDGNVTYLRDAWAADKKRDYLINENADRFGGETHKI